MFADTAFLLFFYFVMCNQSMKVIAIVMFFINNAFNKKKTIMANHWTKHNMVYFQR